jgi:predicted membrane protein
MVHEHKGFIDLRIIIGLAIALFGALLLIRNFDPELARNIWRWWPVLLIAVGLRILIQSPESRQHLTGSIITLIGVLLLLNNLDIIDVRFRYIWPLIIVIIGLAIIFRSSRGGRQAVGTDLINLNLIFGGGEFHYDSPNFRGGKVTAIMGGGVIDLRDARPEANDIVLDVMTIMGGIEVRVPPGWQVALEGTPILGGMENKTATRDRESGTSNLVGKRLIVRGMTIMGGLEVKN